MSQIGNHCLQIRVACGVRATNRNATVDQDTAGSDLDQICTTTDLCPTAKSGESQLTSRTDRARPGRHVLGVCRAKCTLKLLPHGVLLLCSQAIGALLYHQVLIDACFLLGQEVRHSICSPRNGAELGLT